MLIFHTGTVEAGCCSCVTPKPGWSPRDLCLHKVGVAAPQPTRKEKLSCCSKGDKT